MIVDFIGFERNEPSVLRSSIYGRFALFIRALSCLILLGVLCVVRPVAVVAAEPPIETHVNHGWKEWQSTGVYPKEFVLPIRNPEDERNHRDHPTHHSMILASSFHPVGESPPNYVQIDLYRRPAAKPNQKESSKDQLILRLADSPDVGQSSLLWDGFGEVFEPHTGDIFPYCGQLLGVTKIDHHQLVLSVIDRERVPDNVWPKKRTRLFSVNQPQGGLTFFGYRPTSVKGKPREVTFGRIRTVKIDPQKRRAEVAVAPVKNFRESIDDVKQTIQDVSKGDVLRAGLINYRVVNVVAPQDLKNGGRLVGWIELDPEPVANP